MLHNKIIWAAMLSFVTLGMTAYAADLQNMDDKSYTIYLETDNDTKTIVIGPHETISDVCSECYISIEDTESAMSIEKEPLIMIKDGQLVMMSPDK